MPDEKKVEKTGEEKKGQDASKTSQDGQFDASAITDAATSIAASATQIAAANVPAEAPVTPPPPPPVFNLPKIDTKEYFENPVENTAKVVGSMLAPVIHQYGEGAVAQQKALLQSQVGEKYTEYSSEIDTMLNSLTPEQRTLPDIVQKTYDFVRGKHVEDIVAKEREAIDVRVAEEVKKRTSSLPGGGAGGPAEATTSKLTDEQQEACRNLNMKEEDYLTGIELGEG